MKQKIKKIIFGPPNWLTERFDSESRRAFGFWTLLAAVAGTPFFGRQVLYVTILSLVALIPNFTSETPVEVEGEEKEREA